MAATAGARLDFLVGAAPEPGSSPWSRQVLRPPGADGIDFLNGMVLTLDSSTLTVAETFATASPRATSPRAG